MTHCRRCLVSGKVQGVWFRETTRREATRLGLTGYALNMPDGCVEVVACGEKDGLERLGSWLWEGSSSAIVDSVVCEECELLSFSGFSTR